MTREKGKAGDMSSDRMAAVQTSMSCSVTWSGRTWTNRQEEPFLQNPRAKYWHGFHPPSASLSEKLRR